MIKRMLWFATIVVYVCGCTTVVPISAAPDQIGSALKVGDKTVLTLRDGQSREFAVTRASSTEVCGERECVAVGDVTSAGREEFSGAKTVLLVVLIVLVIVAAAAATQSGVSLYGGPPTF